MTLQIPAVMQDAENLESICNDLIDQKVSGRLDAIFGNAITAGN
jgi:hypothetical protein